MRATYQGRCCDLPPGIKHRARALASVTAETVEEPASHLYAAVSAAPHLFEGSQLWSRSFGKHEALQSRCRGAATTKAKISSHEGTPGPGLRLQAAASGKPRDAAVDMRDGNEGAQRPQDAAAVPRPTKPRLHPPAAAALAELAEELLATPFWQGGAMWKHGPGSQEREGRVPPSVRQTASRQLPPSFLSGCLGRRGRAQWKYGEGK